MQQTMGPDAGEIATALDAFLAFRETDMELWRRASTELDLSMLAMLALARVLRAHDQGTPMRQVDLTRSLRISAAGASQIIDTLAERRLVNRVRHAEDRRAYVLEPGVDAAAITRDVLDGDTEFARLAEALSPEGLSAFVHMMRGMTAASAAKFST